MKTVTAFFLLTIAGSAYGAAPLFMSDDALKITIEAPMRDLIRNKTRDHEYDAIVKITGSDGVELELEATISPRGNSRLRSCNFPPIRLEFDPAKTVGTVFAEQKRLKMVTHCMRGSDGNRWVLQEYGIYRAYNAITDYSFRVRKLDVSYRDTESDRYEREAPAFFIEDIDDAAERLNSDSIRPPEVRTEQYHLVETTHQMLFQYLIANTDFSVKRGSTGEGCCHNGRIVAEPGSQQNWTILPYDFDQAGIINTEYALPDRRLGIRRVTSRLYRGFCWQNDSLAGSVDRFREQREAITGALIPGEISASKQTRIRRYIERFYNKINDPEELQDDLIDQCRGGATFAIRKTRTAGE